MTPKFRDATLGNEDPYPDEPLVVDINDPHYEVMQAMRMLLKGRWNVEKTFKRIAPFYEWTSSPLAEQAVGWIEAYSLGVIDLTELKKCFDEAVEEAKNAGH